MTRTRARLNDTSWTIIVATGALCLFGLLTLWGIERGAGDTPDNTIKQGVCTMLGLMLAVAIVRLGYQRITQHAYLLAGLALLLLVPLLVAKKTGFDFGGLVPERRNTYRWIQLPGLQFQPSELVKIAFVLALSEYLKYRKNFRTFAGLLVPFVLSLVPLLLILLQPDLGTALLIVPVLFVMLFAAGAKVKHLAIIVALAFASLPFLWTQIEPYQKARTMAFVMQSDTLRRQIDLTPERFEFTGVTRQEARNWHRSSGMQLVLGKAALGSGGLFGHGWAQGTYVEYSFLPERDNDFIFAIVGHQFGLVGCAFVLTAIGVLVIAGLAAATATAEPQGRLLAIGVIALLASQTAINVGMTLGLMPITGMTLPFISKGGSSLIINLMAVALLISVAQHRPFLLAPKPFEFGQGTS